MFDTSWLTDAYNDDTDWSWNFFDADLDWWDPIILDLEGNGVDLTPRVDSTAFFNLDADPFKEQTAWMGRGDGMLVIDKPANGGMGVGRADAGGHPKRRQTVNITRLDNAIATGRGKKNITAHAISTRLAIFVLLAPLFYRRSVSTTRGIPPNVPG